jgi:hypothetical protein
MIREKATSALASGFGRGFLWGAGLALGATLLIPGVRKRVRPLLVQAAGGVMSLRNEIEAQTAELREDLQDIVEEARHERDQTYGAPPVAPSDAAPEGEEAPEG